MLRHGTVAAPMSSDDQPRISRSTMQVAIDVGPLYGHRSGVGVAVDGMLDGLRRHDEVHLDQYLVSSRSTPEPGHRRLPIPGIVASHLWARTGHPKADRWLAGVDVVHGTNYTAPPSSVPTVISVYDCWFLAHPADARPIVRRAGDQLRRSIDAGAWVHTSSEATATAARTLLDTDRVVAVPLGPPPTPSPPSGPPQRLTMLGGKRFVLAIGTEERRKDLRLLVESFEILLADHADVRLVLAGAPGDDTDRITRAVSALPDSAADRIHRLGVIDDTEKAWLLQHAAVLAYPSLDEGFGFPILEAQASGTPVVAFSVGSIPEVAGDAAVLVGDRDPIRFADALGRTLGDDRPDLVESGRRNVARFSWERCADGLVSLYRNALEAQR